MEIKPYKKTDNHAVAAFYREIFNELGWTERPSDHMDQPHLLFHLPNHGVLLLVKENQRVIGTAGVIILNGDEGLIKRFYLSLNSRGSGIAKHLLEELISYARKLGVKKLILDVSKNNSRAIHFYEKSGFLHTSVEPQEDWPESKEPDTHLYMFKSLESEQEA